MLKYRWYGWLIYIMLKSRDIHTCKISELCNVVIIHRAQMDNRQF